MFKDLWELLGVDFLDSKKIQIGTFNEKRKKTPGKSLEI